MQDDDLSLQIRIQRVEQRLRRMMLLGGAVLAAASALFFLGQGQPAQAPQRVDAQSFELRDPAGKIRGEFSTRVDQSPKLCLYDETGPRREELSLLSEGSPGLRLPDRRERIRATLGLIEHEPSLELRDGDGRERAKLILLANGEPSFLLTGSERADLVRSSQTRFPIIAAGYRARALDSPLPAALT